MSALKLISAEKPAERPYYFQVRKGHLMGNHPTMAKLNYDPFPESEMDDVVRTEIIGRELVLKAKFEGDDFLLGPGKAVEYEGRKFAINSAKIDFGTGITEIEATTFLVLEEPPALIARLRDFYAANNTGR